MDKSSAIDGVEYREYLGYLSRSACFAEPEVSLVRDGVLQADRARRAQKSASRGNQSTFHNSPSNRTPSRGALSWCGACCS